MKRLRESVLLIVLTTIMYIVEMWVYRPVSNYPFLCGMVNGGLVICWMKVTHRWSAPD